MKTHFHTTSTTSLRDLVSKLDGGVPVDFDEPFIPEPEPTTPEPEAKPKPKPKKKAFFNEGSIKQFLDCKENGRPESNLKNAIRLLQVHYDWLDTLAYDEFSMAIRLRKPAPWGGQAGLWSETDDIRLANWLQSKDVIVNPNVARDAVVLVAKDSTIHPVKDYLRKLEWDGKPRVASWLATYIGAQPTLLNSTIGKGWLISAVARIQNPGCQVDHTLSLEGKQGIGKSTALRILASDSWFSDHVSDLASKDSRLELLGRWIIEISEFSAIRRAEVERVKAFLTCRHDIFRPPYEKRTTAFPRQCVFSASFNDPEPFADSSGNRRFWPVQCGTFNLKKLEADRDMIWAEAMKLYRDGESWWLKDADLQRQMLAEQASRFQDDPWKDLVLSWATQPETKTVTDFPLISTPGSVVLEEILTHCIGMPVKDQGQTERNRVARIMLANGWIKSRLKSGTRSRVYVMPELPA